MSDYNCKWEPQQPQFKRNTDPLGMQVWITTPWKQPNLAELLEKSEGSLECVVEEEDDKYQLWPGEQL